MLVFSIDVSVPKDSIEVLGLYDEDEVIGFAAEGHVAGLRSDLILYLEISCNIKADYS